MKKKLMLVGAILFVATKSFGQTQELNVPQFRSDEEKVKWVNDHPEEYRKMNGINEVEVSEQVVFKSDAEKSAYMKKNGLGNEITILESEPGFPKYIDTGDPEGDKADYASRKDKWIEENRERYEKISAAPIENLTPEQRLQKGEIIIRN